MGASVESARLAGWPCFQDGGAACCAQARAASMHPIVNATVTDVRVMRRMMCLPFEDR